MHLSIGGLSIRIDAPPAARQALLARFGDFVSPVDAPPDVDLVVTTGAAFDPGFALDPRSSPDLAIALSGDRVRFAGAAEGELELATPRARLAGASHLGQIDAVLRLALSLKLPARGGLLVHGTAIVEAGTALLLLGDSGAGKSTAAAAFGGSLSDELTVLRLGDGEVLAHGTPYWRGRSASAPVRLIACLDRETPSRSVALAGADRVRAIAAHVVHYLSHPVADLPTLSLLAEVANRVPVVRISCPSGADYLPFLRNATRSPPPPKV